MKYQKITKVSKNSQQTNSGKDIYLQNKDKKLLII